MTKSTGDIASVSTLPVAVEAKGPPPARTGGWLPCPGRPIVCRRFGCNEAAADETIRLCPAHFATYESDVERSQFIFERAGVAAARSLGLPEAHASTTAGGPPVAA
ncbi:MAG: hypothetical protein ACYCST_09880 [Acidimicrobiales bacterium]